MQGSCGLGATRLPSEGESTRGARVGQRHHPALDARRATARSRWSSPTARAGRRASPRRPACRSSWSSAPASAPTSTASPTPTRWSTRSPVTRSTWSRWPASARSSTSRSTTRIRDRIVNTHPALLPCVQGRGTRSTTRSPPACKVTGCTVHFARSRSTTGRSSPRRRSPVRADDTVETLHERIKEVERRIYPAVLADLLTDIDSRNTTSATARSRATLRKEA